MLGYEYALHYYGLTTYIFHVSRTDFVSANREGLCSLVGYLALQFIGIGLGEWQYR